eukprot:GEMP01006627.1.p1 GENE.GEMP01006627.1~~GEMP01006627.1.p1  ORF type:complete len:377 (+),score=59.33 GEMP01006627.1:247-1377(+)
MRYCQLSSCCSRPWPSSLKARIGMRYMLASGFLFSLQALLAKDSMTNVSAFEVAFWRAATIAICVTVYIATTAHEKWHLSTWFGEKSARKWILMTMFFNYSQNALFFSSLEFLTLGDANILFFSAPIWSAVIAWLCIGERTTGYTFLVIVACIFGVILTARPWETSLANRSVQGIVLALGGSVTQALCFTLLRKMRGIPWYTMMFSHLPQTLLAFVVAHAVGGRFGFKQFTWTVDSWVLRECIATGCLAFLAQTCLIVGSKTEKAIVATASRTIDIPLAMFYQVIYFRESLNALSFLGGLVISVSVIVLAFSKDTSDDHVATPTNTARAGRDHLRMQTLRRIQDEVHLQDFSPTKIGFIKFRRGVEDEDDIEEDED